MWVRALALRGVGAASGARSAARLGWSRFPGRLSAQVGAGRCCLQGREKSKDGRRRALLLRQEHRGDPLFTFLRSVVT